MLGAPVTDEFSHQFLGLITESGPNGTTNPRYDDVNNDGQPDGRVEPAIRLHRDRLRRNRLPSSATP